MKVGLNELRVGLTEGEEGFAVGVSEGESVGHPARGLPEKALGLIKRSGMSFWMTQFKS